MTILSRPALAISRMSSSSSEVEIAWILIGALPCCLNVSFSFWRLSNWMLLSRTAIVLPARSSTVAIAGAPGPVTTISLTSFLVGIEKSTIAARSGVTVTPAAMMSPRPSISD